MAASDNLGTICVIFPPGPMVMILALIWILFGFHHIVHVTASILGVLLDSSHDWGMASSCQGSVCHEEWRDSFMSCAGIHRTTYRIRYLAIGILGMFFGALGFQGVISRRSAMVRSFLYFWVAMTILFFVLYIADQVYVELCDVLPRNLQLDVEWFISREQLALMRAQGFKDLTNVRVEKVKHLVGFDWNPFYSSLYFAILLFYAYWCWQISIYVNNVDEGPVGIGPNFVISTKPHKEVEEMASRMEDAVQDYFDSVPHYYAFPQLSDSNVFPYIPKKSGSAPSINYGTMGIPRPSPPAED